MKTKMMRTISELATSSLIPGMRLGMKLSMGFAATVAFASATPVPQALPSSKPAANSAVVPSPAPSPAHPTPHASPNAEAKSEAKPKPESKSKPKPKPSDDSAVSGATRLYAWPYIQKAAEVTQYDRKVDGITLVVAGGAAIALPFLVTKSDSPLRRPLEYALIPTGSLSVLVGGYYLFSNSQFRGMERRAEELAGPKPASTATHEEIEQYRLRRELHARELLMERGDRSRLSRFILGGMLVGGGIYLVSRDQTSVALASSGLLFTLAAYHLFVSRSEERIVDDLREAIGEESSPLPKTGLILQEGAPPQLALTWRF